MPDGSIPPIDAPAAPSDGPPDSPPSQTPSSLVANDGSGPIAQWTSPATFVNTTSSVRLFIMNPSASATSTLTPTITGAGAASFSIVSAGTTCGPALAAHDACWLDVQFAPTASGTPAATLAIDAGNAALTLPLTGSALDVPTTGLVASVASIDFGDVELNTTATAQVLLSNPSTSTTITMGARTAAAPFGISDNCPSTLTPGGACTVTVGFESASPGSFAGTLTVTSDTPTVTIPLHADVLRRITVVVSGSGQGAVTSLPSGIQCGSTCAADFPGGVDVSLTATPSGGGVFSGWNGLCQAASGSCVVASPTEGNVTAFFLASTAKQISVTFAGTGVGLAMVADVTNNRTVECTSSCTTYVDANVSVSVAGFSPSTFVGWSGDCTATTHDCSLGTVINNRAVTLTANADPHEAGTLLPSATVTGLAIAPTGDVVIANATGVSQVAVAGNVVWSTPITGGATSLATDSAGDVYGVGSASVFALSPTGAVAWTRAITGVTANPDHYYNSTIAASPDGTVIAVLTADGVHVVDGSGSDRFTITGLSPAPQNVAVAADGTVGLIQLDNSIQSGQTKALLYSPAGTSLPTFPLLPGDGDSALAFDATDAVCVVSTGFSELTTSRLTAPSTVAWSSVEHVGGTGAEPAGVLVDSSGEVVQISPNSLGAAQGLQLEVFSSTGTVVLNQTKATDFFATPPFVFEDSVQPSIVATGGTNRMAIAGEWGSGPWIQVFDLP